ncbi:uncharacterized protein [Venturia canescens]|uniref:uncharacterized protein n=1 Tax=Venturia canescens TaxID=32260 RepID=UPI001C9D0F41|nr:uncharacterized protein LOC122411356 [Venturia canescens]
MQDLWLAKIDWDDDVPQSIQEDWERYCYELPDLSSLKIPRWIGLTQSHCAMELHGFADASQRAYSAVVYLRVLKLPTDTSVSLIAAKSRVTPLKTVAIPRLELNGIVLLVRLLEYVREALKIEKIPVHGWTDSTVALSWLTQHPSRWKPWSKLLRVTGLLFFWLNKFRAQKRDPNRVPPAHFTDSVQAARDFWIRKIQNEHFAAEIRALQEKEPLPRATDLKALNPFLDGKGQLRLGGRLRHSFLSYDERYPLILPRHHVSELIIDQTHSRSLHGGPQLTLRLLRQNYWILGARSLVKSRINRCLNCARERAVSASQLMGDLPSPRVNPSPPFSHCGVDYAGPFHITPFVGRGQKSRKYYVALFVCLATRAVHLEYVDDYATSGFIAAFQRFVSRRGLPSDMYSDNGTNFQGADNELRRAFLSTLKNPDLHAKFETDGIRWHFIPASAPHFGGLWEAGVKSFKHHLKRVVGTHTLSQLEFSTLLCAIEACLTSRPLAPLSDDPDNFDALTPGHFLIGRPLLSVPEPSLLELNENRLSRWQKVLAMREHIWKAWSHDYLHTLQQRAKWQKASRSVQVDALVLLKNEQLLPCRWELARVVATHPGPDGFVRVVTLRTAKTQLKRPIAKVCPLLHASDSA